MEKYKLYNTIKNEISKKDGKIEKHKFSYKLIEGYFNQYSICEFVIKNYCCYGEDKCCWIDEDYSWAVLAGTVDKLYSSLKTDIKMAKKINKKVPYDRNIFVSDIGQYITIIIPLRDILKRDYYITFEKQYMGWL